MPWTANGTNKLFLRAANGALSKHCPTGFKLLQAPSPLSQAPGVPVVRIAAQGFCFRSTSCFRITTGTVPFLWRSARCFSIYAGRQGEQFVSSQKKQGLHGRKGVDPENTLWWVAGVLVMMFGGVWLTVPLYKMYCQAYGDGTATRNTHKDYAPPFDPNSDVGKRLMTVDFQGTVHDTLPWEFVPQQKRLTVSPGETALAFYRAKNCTDRPVIGISVYHMIPPESGLYFNKIQCFCFDEQLLNPNEEVDMPLLFYIDPEIVHDERFHSVDHISLQYIFFESDSDVPQEYYDLHRAQKLEYQKAQPRGSSMAQPAAKALDAPDPSKGQARLAHA